MPRRKRDVYVTLDEIIDAIKAHRGKPRVAISITGGGARGPYEAGVAEALMRKLRAANIVPDIITGTSAGSIISTALFVDAFAPPQAGPVFVNRQSAIWKNVGAGAKGASQVLDKAWIVEYASGEKPIPVLTQITSAIANLRSAWNGLSADLQAAGRDASAFLSSVKDAVDSQAVQSDLSSIAATLSADANSISNAWNGVVDAWNNVNLEDLSPTSPRSFVGEIENLGTAVDSFASTLPPILADFVSGAADLTGDEITGVIDSLSTIVGDAERVLGDVLAVLGDGTKLVGNAARLALWCGVVAVLLEVVLFHISWLFVAVAGVEGALSLTDHIFDNAKIEGLLSGLIAQAFPLPSNHKDNRSPGSRLLQAYAAQRDRGKDLPELYLTGSNLTASRLAVFAVASSDRIAELAQDGTWVVDLAGSSVPTGSGSIGENVLMAQIRAEDTDLLVKATMTSSTIPGVFQPQLWHLVRDNPDASGARQSLAHVFVDGGVIDNSPIDMAIYAGADVVISVELSPLLGRETDFTINDDLGNYNIYSVMGDAFFTAMDAGLANDISAILEDAESNAKQPAVYRLAPLIPNKFRMPRAVELSPGMLDFDGVYSSDDNHLVMNLYDWFIQGYVDAMSYTAADAKGENGVRQTDPVLRDYFTAPSAARFVAPPQFCGNRFWSVGERPLPETADARTAHIALPDLLSLATNPPYNYSRS